MEEKTLKVNESGGKPGRSRRNKAARAAGTVFRILFLAGVSLVIGVNIYVLNAKKIGGNRLPMPFGYGAAVVMSGSMEPVLKVGDLVIVKEVSESRKKSIRTEILKSGDVVIYDNGSSLIIHRITDVLDNGMYIMKGDANNTEDEPVEARNILGVLVKRISGIGDFLLVLKNPFVIAGLLTAAILIIEIGSAREKEQNSESINMLRREIEELKSEDEKQDR